MTIQYIFTFAIIAAAAGITGYRTWRFLRNPSRKCNGCSSSCGGCSVDMLKKAIEEKKRGTYVKS
jgi:hypothetical protein